MKMSMNSQSTMQPENMMYDLSRFHAAQKRDYQTALSEIRNGRKRSHWIWYIFPQIAGLGFSSTSQFYAIKDMDEAREYLKDPVLKAHLEEISSALLELDSSNPSSVMGYPDDLKLCSSMTLFEAADPECSIYPAVLDKFFNGKRDQATLDILGI